MIRGTIERIRETITERRIRNFQTYQEKGETSIGLPPPFGPTDTFLAATYNDWLGLERELKTAVIQRKLTPRQARQVENHYRFNQRLLSKINPPFRSTFI